MAFDPRAQQDYERAIRKALWRTVSAWFTGQNNELLPFEEVRHRLPFKGQRYVGLRQVPIEQVVGSLGRYRDFDRAFLPKQIRTRDRWVSIDTAHYSEIPLPPVELYKMGEIYFVKDGHHRVSVASERGQAFIDAYVTEIDIPVSLTLEDDLGILDLKVEQARFLEETKINEIRPDIEILMTLPGEYERLLEHISVHRWYLGEQRQAEAPYEEAVASWVDNVYSPMVELIRDHGLLKHFPDRTESDLYLWMIEYMWYRRGAYKEEFALQTAATQFSENFQNWPVDRLAKLLTREAWVDHIILEKEQADFAAKTQILANFPDARIELTVPGQYDKLLDHISVHRWYLGEQRNAEVPYEEAAASWYEKVYLPLVRLIREQEILIEFPGRTVTDLYLWVIEHQDYLVVE